MSYNLQEYVASLPRPECAAKINGVYLEQLIPGYRTHSIKGRESVSITVNESETKNMSGAIYRNKHDNTKEITIDFGLACDKSASIQSSISKILYQLRQEPNDIVFDDDPEYHWFGVLSSIENIEKTNTIDTNHITGSLVLYLSKPYKFSDVKTITKKITGGSGKAIFQFNYNGLKPSKPTISVSMTGTNDCVICTDNNGNILQFGKSDSTASSNTVFGNGNKVEINTERYRIDVDGSYRPDLGAIDNKWEEFQFQNGSNTVIIAVSSWAAEATVTLSYREVY